KLSGGQSQTMGSEPNIYNMSEHMAWPSPFDPSSTMHTHIGPCVYESCPSKSYIQSSIKNDQSKPNQLDTIVIEPNPNIHPTMFHLYPEFYTAKFANSKMSDIKK
ncbi:MAG: hypothetical protein MUO21_11835, partial [Nitrososphaeraceae archaeon]|nr:hypothetical protein [Nitrososphaeraceae archaeon]